MKFSTIIVLGLLAVSAFAEYPEEDDVLVLGKDNFKQALEEFEFMMVEFYAPWCGHCKKLVPEYSKAAAELKQRPEGYIPLAKVDATQENELAQSYGVQGYPTLKFFVRGKEQTYEGGRTSGDIVAWINKRTGPATQTLSTLEEVQAFVDRKSSSPVVVFFGEDEAQLALFKEVAQQEDKILFATTDVAEAKTQFNVPAGVSVVLFKDFDEERNDFSGDLETLALKQFVNVNSIPTVLPFNDKAIQAVFQQGNPALILFANENDASNAAYNAFASVAKEFKDKVKFTFSKPDDGFGLFSRLAEYVGASQSDVPNIMLVDPNNANAKYKFTSEITAENIRDFTTRFVEKRLERYMKSEEVPVSNDQPVKVIVGKSFKQLVVDSPEDVLVEFYAPWCGHCKQLVPIYDELATKLAASNPNIVIAKVDATANECEGVDVQSFPTLKFWKNGQKDTPIAYNGNRDLEGFLSFLKENTSYEWKDAERVEDL